MRDLREKGSDSQLGAFGTTGTQTRTGTLQLLARPRAVLRRGAAAVGRLLQAREGRAPPTPRGPPPSPSVSLAELEEGRRLEAELAQPEVFLGSLHSGMKVVCAPRSADEPAHVVSLGEHGRARIAWTGRPLCDGLLRRQAVWRPLPPLMVPNFALCRPCIRAAKRPENHLHIPRALLPMIWLAEAVAKE